MSRAIGLGTVVLSCLVTIANAHEPVAMRYPAGAIRSVADADAALAEVAKERKEIEARFSQAEQSCLPRFFATSCIEQAKEQRRKDMATLRPIEIEANTFKRQARVIAREQELADRREKAETTRNERAVQNSAPEKEPTSGAEPGNMGHGPATAEPGQAAPRSEPAATVRNAEERTHSDRVRRHEEKLRRVEAADAADAKKREENIAAYERKAERAAARQREVAERKAEKEQKRKESLESSSKP